MFGKKSENHDSRLIAIDRLGKLILRAVGANEQEIEQASAAPFLLTRIRARIAEQQRENESVGWLWLPNIAWRAVPAMALVASITGGLLLWSARSTSAPNTANTTTGFGMYEDALNDTTNPGVEQTVLSRNNLSREEIFTIVVDRNEREQK